MDFLSVQQAQQDFQKWVDSELDTAPRVTEYPISHYTTAEGAEGIIKSSAIWLTEYRHFNDPGEIDIGIKLAQKISSQKAEELKRQKPTMQLAFAEIFAKSIV